jgi:hypothetical protein
MGVFLEPVYLNEKMVLNCAAYLFQGFSLESEKTEEKSSLNKGNLSLGFKFLQSLLSPINAEAEQQKISTTNVKTARRYTLGGLHMVVLDELKKQKQVVQFSPDTRKSAQVSYVDFEVILKPIDFFTIMEVVKVLIPLVSQFLKNFGPKIKPQVFSKKVVDDIPKYEGVAKAIMEGLEQDYMKSKQIEMIMLDPQQPQRQIGLLDLGIAQK